MLQPKAKKCLKMTKKPTETSTPAIHAAAVAVAPETVVFAQSTHSSFSPTAEFFQTKLHF